MSGLPGAPARPRLRDTFVLEHARGLGLNGTDTAPWRYYLGLYSSSARALLLSVAAAAAAPLALLPVAMLVRDMFDVELSQGSWPSLMRQGLLIVALYLVSGGMSLLARYTGLSVTKEVIRRLRYDILSRLYELPYAEYDGTDTGRLHSAIVHDTERLDVASNALIGQVLPSLVACVGLCAILLYLNLLLCLVLLVLFPVLALATSALRNQVRASVRSYHKAFGAFSRGTLLALRAMLLTRIQAAEDQELARQGGVLDEVRTSSADMAWTQARYKAVHDNSMALVGVIILVVGGGAVMRGQMSLGEVLAFYACVSLLRGYASSLVGGVPTAIAGKECLDRLYPVVAPKKAGDDPCRQRIRLLGDIRLDGVSFGYDGSSVLDRATLHLRPGRRVALTGENGAGKSTIIHLILGLYPPTSGTISVDGESLAEIDPRHYRRQIGVVTQQPFLFPGTVAENILYGAREATEEEMREAAELATADEVITQLPQGYQTAVGEDGRLLSGGQRQRIAIARALLGSPAVVILDEPTNHLDPAAVVQLLDNLRSKRAGLSALVISHAPEVLAAVDEVYELRDGRLWPSALAGVAVAEADHFRAGERTEGRARI